MKYTIVELSQRRFAIGEISETGQSNLQIYTDDELGDKNEMISVSQVKLITGKLDWRTAMKLYCYLTKNVDLPDTLRELLL